jgi:hypothetical protein
VRSSPSVDGDLGVGVGAAVAAERLERRHGELLADRTETVAVRVEEDVGVGPPAVAAERLEAMGSLGFSPLGWKPSPSVSKMTSVLEKPRWLPPAPGMGSLFFSRLGWSGWNMEAVAVGLQSTG